MPYDPTTQPYDEPSRHVDCADDGESRLPLQYEDGPDFCTVRDAQGRDFALTVQPDLMKAMEKALAASTGPTEPLQCLRCGTVDAFGAVNAR